MMVDSSRMQQVAAYPPAWPRHLAWRALAARWHRRGGLTDAQLAATAVAYPLDYYRPAWPIRVALFCVTVLGVLLGSGFLALLAAGATVGDFNVTAWAVLLLISSGVLLELTIRHNRLYHAGPDNALLYAALLAAAVLIGRLQLLRLDGSVNDFSLGQPSLLPSLLLLLVVLLAAGVRYADRGVAGAAFVGYLLVIANLLLPWGWGRLLLPFGMMAAAGMVVWLARTPRQVLAATYYYEGARQTLRLLALVVFYLAGNYLVVREGNASLRGDFVSAHPPLGALFIGLTAAVPLAYVALGLRRHDRLLLTLGLLAAAFSVYTLRAYRSVLPPAIAASLAGAALVILAVVLLRYLRPRRHGLTSLPDAGAASADDTANPFARANLEALAAVELTPVAAPDAGPATTFGGGEFGGGGASSGY
ncbi:MAG: hypothetical protein H7330_13570 [Hymenobacteraceae bacterium]|nr:hypothetical protein [Hymenobacteraceae bacterium]